MSYINILTKDAARATAFKVLRAAFAGNNIALAMIDRAEQEQDNNTLLDLLQAVADIASELKETIEYNQHKAQ